MQNQLVDSTEKATAFPTTESSVVTVAVGAASGGSSSSSDNDLSDLNIGTHTLSTHMYVERKYDTIDVVEESKL